MVVAFTLMAALRAREEKGQETAPAWEHGNGTTLRIGMHSGGWQDGRHVKKKKKKTVHKPKHAWLATPVPAVSLPYHSLYTANLRADV